MHTWIGLEQDIFKDIAASRNPFLFLSGRCDVIPTKEEKAAVSM